MTDVVSALIVNVADRLIMPRFRALQPDEVTAKDTPGDPDDVVTVADREAEEALVAGLRTIVPRAAFIGEEAVSADAALLDPLQADGPVWLIDPIDGTKNFSRGDARFGVMLALVEDGRTRASWMYMPAMPGAPLVSAEQGAGTRVNGRHVKMTSRTAAQPKGTVHTRMMPRADADDVLRRLDGRYEPRASTGSAATEYSEILQGHKDFVIYYRLLPWDHAPGALAMEEAGGATLHLAGAPYTPRSTNQITLFAATAELARTIHRWLTV